MCVWEKCPIKNEFRKQAQSTNATLKVLMTLGARKLTRSVSCCALSLRTCGGYSGCCFSLCVRQFSVFSSPPGPVRNVWDIPKAIIVNRPTRPDRGSVKNVTRARPIPPTERGRIRKATNSRSITLRASHFPTRSHAPLRTTSLRTV